MYRNDCITCGIKYESEREARIGFPCPNSTCPRGNPILTYVSKPASPPRSWQNRIIKTAGVVGGISALGGILYFNIGGWGAFFEALLVATLVQFVIALILFGVIIATLKIAFKKFFGSILNRRGLAITLLLTILLAAPISAIISGRSLDIYDAVQTIILGIATNLLSKPVEHIFNRLWNST